MWKTFQLSLKTKCFLCDSFFDQSRESYILYKCFFCKKFTHYCFFCSLKAQKLFYGGNFFKCFYCNKLTNALDKIQINPYLENYLKIPNEPHILTENLIKLNKNNSNKIILKNKKTKNDKNNLTCNNKFNEKNFSPNNKNKMI